MKRWLVARSVPLSKGMRTGCSVLPTLVVAARAIEAQGVSWLDRAAHSAASIAQAWMPIQLPFAALLSELVRRLDHYVGDKEKERYGHDRLRSTFGVDEKTRVPEKRQMIAVVASHLGSNSQAPIHESYRVRRDSGCHPQSPRRWQATSQSATTTAPTFGSTGLWAPSMAVLRSIPIISRELVDTRRCWCVEDPSPAVLAECQQLATRGTSPTSTRQSREVAHRALRSPGQIVRCETSKE